MRTKRNGSRPSMGTNSSIDASTHLLRHRREDEDVKSWCKLRIALRSRFLWLNAIDVINDTASLLKWAHRNPVPTAPGKPVFLKKKPCSPTSWVQKKKKKDKGERRTANGPCWKSLHPLAWPHGNVPYPVQTGTYWGLFTDLRTRSKTCRGRQSKLNLTSTSSPRLWKYLGDSWGRLCWKLPRRHAKLYFWC